MTDSLRWLAAACLLLSGCVSLTDRSNGSPDQSRAADIYLRKGVEYMERGNYRVAREDLQKAVALDGHNSEAHNALAVLLERMEQPGEAARHFREALQQDPDNLAARNNLARFLCTRGQPEEALRQFQRVIDSRLYPHPEVALTNAGLCAETVGDADQAERYLRRALAFRADFAPALGALARLSQCRGQHLAARGFLQRYLERTQPDAATLRLGMAIETSLGNLDAAASHARQLRQRWTAEVDQPSADPGRCPAH
jgi:type IV pilus assembly protein PilF